MGAVHAMWLEVAGWKSDGSGGGGGGSGGGGSGGGTGATDWLVVVVSRVHCDAASQRYAAGQWCAAAAAA